MFKKILKFLREKLSYSYQTHTQRRISELAKIAVDRADLHRLMREAGMGGL